MNKDQYLKIKSYYLKEALPLLPDENERAKIYYTENPSHIKATVDKNVAVLLEAISTLNLIGFEVKLKEDL